MFNPPRRAIVCLCLMLVVPLGGCGDEETSAPPPPRPIPALPDLPFADRVAFALERLDSGPERQTELFIPQRLHLTLDLARRDLIDMPQETLAALGEPDRIARITSALDTNPWHSVLGVLQAIPDCPAELVLEWTRAALDGTDPSLRRRAVRLLSVVEDESVAALLLEFLTRDPDDIEAAQLAYRSLAWFGSPWQEQATAIALRHGIPRLWTRASEDLTTTVRGGAGTPEQAAMLAWTSALMEGSGPRPTAGLPREQSFSWTHARLWTDPQVQTLEREGSDGSLFRVHSFGPVAADVAYGGGWMKSALSDGAAASPAAWVYTGKEPAADNRCILALWGHAPFRHARDFDRETWDAESDSVLYHTAHHCNDRQSEASARQGNLAELALRLDAFAASPDELPDPTTLGSLIDGLPPATDPSAERVLVRCLTELRPLSIYVRIVIRAHDALIDLGPDARVLILKALLESGDVSDRGAALSVIKHARLPEYIPLLEAQLERPGVVANELWPQLVYLYSGALGIEPDTLLRFIKRFEVWLTDTVVPQSGPERAAVLGSGLLDFGHSGAEAYARLLARDDGMMFVSPLIASPLVLAEPIVRALIDRAAAETNEARIREILAIAYQRFPSSSASRLAALRLDLPRRLHGALEVAVNRVRHRGPREAAGL